jgi:hypothetical protein
VSQLTDRELDLAIAEKVMGWEWRQFQPRYSNEWRRVLWESHIKNPEFLPWAGEEMEAIESSFVPHYSTNIEAAFQVAAKFRWMNMGVGLGNEWFCTFRLFDENGESVGNPDGYESYAPTLPLAICLAALKSVEGTK